MRDGVVVRGRGVERDLRERPFANRLGRGLFFGGLGWQTALL